MVAKHVNEKNAGKPRLRSLAALAATFSVVAFYCYLNNYVKLPGAKVNVGEFDVSRIRPRQPELPHLEMLTWQNLTSTERVTRCGRPAYPP